MITSNNQSAIQIQTSREDFQNKIDGLHPGNLGVATGIIRSMTDFGSGWDPELVLAKFAQAQRRNLIRPSVSTLIYKRATDAVRALPMRGLPDVTDPKDLHNLIEGLHPSGSGTGAHTLKRMTDFGSGINLGKALGRAGKLTSQVARDSFAGVRKALKAGYEFGRYTYAPAVAQGNAVAQWLATSSSLVINDSIHDIAMGFATHNAGQVLGGMGRGLLELPISKGAFWLSEHEAKIQKAVTGISHFGYEMVKEYPLESIKQISRGIIQIPKGLIHGGKDISKYVAVGEHTVTGKYAENITKLNEAYSKAKGHIEEAKGYYGSHQEEIKQTLGEVGIKGTHIDAAKQAAEWAMNNKGAAVVAAKIAMKSGTVKEAIGHAQSGDFNKAAETIYNKYKPVADIYNKASEFYTNNKQYVKYGIYGLGALKIGLTGYVGWKLYKHHKQHQQEKQKYNTIQGLHPGTDRPDWWDDDIAFGSGLDIMKVLYRGVDRIEGLWNTRGPVKGSLRAPLEKIYESVRKKHYPTKPSRLTSTFWTSDKMMANMYAQTQGGEDEVLGELKLPVFSSSRIHFGDPTWINGSASDPFGKWLGPKGNMIFGRSRWKEDAHAYWQSKPFNDALSTEEVLSGKGEVLIPSEKSGYIKKNVNISRKLKQMPTAGLVNGVLDQPDFTTNHNKYMGKSYS